MIPARRRFLILLAIPPLLVLVTAGLYMLGMYHLEGNPRDFWSSLEWAAETVTTTGYGADADWRHPVMVLFVISLQFVGVFLVYMIIPFYLIPYIDERFESRLPRLAPKLRGHVVVYRHGRAVETLLEDLETAEIPTLVVECDESEARNLVDRKVKVIYGPTADDVLPQARLDDARCLIANGDDEDNAAVILLARQLGFTGEILALVEDPDLRQPMSLAGADAVYTPKHLLATVLAARASHRLQPRVVGVQHLGRHLEVTEIRIDPTSPLAGQSLAEAGVGAQAGATVLGQWIAGTLETRVQASMRIEPRGVLVVIGRPESLERLGERASGAGPSKRQGPVVVGGCGVVGGKIRQLLQAVDEDVLVIDRHADDVDLRGDVLDPQILAAARLDEARAIILSLDTDSATLFATMIVRNRAPDLPIIARVNEAHNVERIHGAGADFVLSFSHVSSQILARRLLKQESISVDPQLKVVKTTAGKLAGHSPAELKIRDRTGCSVVAVERGDEVIVKLDGGFLFDTADEIYVCGSPKATYRFVQEFSW